MDNVFQQIKDKITCVEYAQKLGWDVKKSGDRTFSLDKGNNPTCLVVYDNYFHDFKTLKSGDVIDLCAFVNYGGDKGKAIKELCQITGVKQQRKYNNWVDYTQNLCNTIQLYHTKLRQQDIDYLHSRNITDETITRLKLGYKYMGSKLGDRLIIPYFKDGYVAYYVARGQNPKYWKLKLDKTLTENIPWGLHTIQQNKDLLVISEGAFDAISFEQEGYSVLSPMGGYFNKIQIKQVIDICKTFNEVFICFDSDTAGENFIMEMAKTLFRNKINFSAYQLENEKDVNDYYVKYNNLDFVKQREKGIEFLCKHIKEKDEFKNFIKSVSRYTAKTTMLDLFKSASSNFDNTWLSALKKQALSCPTEDMIVKEVKYKHKLKFSAGMFYEYLNGVWIMQPDLRIKSYISDELGYYSSGSKLNTIYNLLSVKCFDGTLFNRQNIFNFKNGILNLNTGDFSDHNEIYYSTMQVSYDYIPDVEPKKWLDFLKDIMEDNQQKIDLIQEMMGYILFSDVSLQKCFYLLGSGSNGKSKLLDIITELFQAVDQFGKPVSDPRNVSTVEMSELAERFERINLLNSILNISTETSTNVAGAETIFKKAVVNEIINGAFKGKDSISFTSRAKWIISCNDYIQPRDTSDGFDRRIIFIKFNVKFCDNPIYSNEKQKDDYIVQKILPELPAIFNWTYEGYKKLISKNKFTVTDEQEEMKEEFRVIINPVAGFISDTDFENENIFSGEQFISIKDLYEMYTSYCKRSGHYSLSYNKFCIAFRNTAQSFYQDKLKYKRSGHKRERGYVVLPQF